MACMTLSVCFSVLYSSMINDVYSETVALKAPLSTLSGYCAHLASKDLSVSEQCSSQSVLTCRHVVFLVVQQGEARGGGRQRYSITTQLLILYYILSYEENLLASTKQLGM